MTAQEINNLYGESVFQIRLRVALALLPVDGITICDALERSDAMINILLSEDADELKRRYDLRSSRLQRFTSQP